MVLACYIHLVGDLKMLNPPSVEAIEKAKNGRSKAIGISLFALVALIFVTSIAKFLVNR
ncbi:MAG: hypothetical protein FD128_2517 [Hyphomonadaceae bacterium]|nr:MAG: hypothetical protein FD128_2517 [Hyphomonadaceae bacterium]